MAAVVLHLSLLYLGFAEADSPADGIPPILRSLSPISQGRISILSAVMEHNRGAPWYLSSEFIASFHAYYGHDLSSLSTYACHLRMYGVTLNDTFLTENVHEGVVLARLEYIHPSSEKYKSPPPLYCYYSTNFNTGGDFQVFHYNGHISTHQYDP